MKLTDPNLLAELRIGTAFRLTSFGPFSAPTLLMITTRGDAKENLQIVVVGGHKRGNALVLLPAEAYSSSLAVSRDWLVTNWQKWVDPDSNATDAEVIMDILDELDR
mgnify:CR=1 FL=1